MQMIRDFETNFLELKQYIEKINTRNLKRPFQVLCKLQI